MRDLLRGLKPKAKSLRRQLIPIVDRLYSGNPMKSIINFGGQKPVGIKRQHPSSRQIFWIKISFPLWILETRCAHPNFHTRGLGRKSVGQEQASSAVTKFLNIRAASCIRIQCGGEFFAGPNIRPAERKFIAAQTKQERET